MKIAVSMIALNEEEYIARAISSCAFAGGVYVLDGESSDKTVNKAKRASEVATRPWDNHFGNQRQVALEMVSADFDWWIRLDADEVFPKHWTDDLPRLLAGLPETVLACRIKQINLVDDEQHYSAARGGWETHPRVFRNLWVGDEPAWRWTGQVHEYCQLMTRDGLREPRPDEVASLNLNVVHYGWLNQQRRAEREELYATMPGSGIKQGDLIKRTHVVRDLPLEA